MKEFNKTGLYLFKVKFDLEDDEIYWDKEYEYDIYYFKTKKLYEENKYSKHKEYFVESTKGLLPKDLKNAKYIDYEESFEFDKEDFSDFKPFEYNPKSIYCTVISTNHIDDLILTNENYSQKVYEFKNEKDMQEFIKNGKLKGNLVFENREKEIIYKKNKSKFSYLVSSQGKTKEVKKEYFINNEETHNKEVTKVIFYPSLDTYLFTCHEDYIRGAVDQLTEFTFKGFDIKKFIDAVKEELNCSLENDKDFSCKYIGNTINLDADDPHCTIDECVHVINTYLKLDLIFSQSDLDAIKNLIENEELLYLIKSTLLNDDTNLKSFKESIEKIKIADYHTNKEKAKTKSKQKTNN